MTTKVIDANSFGAERELEDYNRESAYIDAEHRQQHEAIAEGAEGDYLTGEEEPPYPHGFYDYDEQEAKAAKRITSRLSGERGLAEQRRQGQHMLNSLQHILEVNIRRGNKDLDRAYDLLNGLSDLLTELTNER